MYRALLPSPASQRPEALSSQPEALHGASADGLEECSMHKVSKCLLSAYQCQALGLEDKTRECSGFLPGLGHSDQVYAVQLCLLCSWRTGLKRQACSPITPVNAPLLPTSLSTAASGAHP